MRVRGMVLGGYTGRAIPGYYPAAKHPDRKDPYDSEAGPGSPAGAGVGGHMGPSPGCATARYHPTGPVGLPAGALPVPGLRLAASWPIRTRLRSKPVKVSQNLEVSPKSVKKASHSPCFQNGLQKSALEILRFPISLAFSGKELMGHI